MIDRRQFLSSGAAALLAIRARSMFALIDQQASSPSLGVGKRLVLQAPLGNPFYAWPRTLLSYPASQEIASNPRGFDLVCAETNEIIPFQVSSATASASPARQTNLLFFSDLPFGAKRTFTIQPAAKGASQKLVGPTITVASSTGAVTIDAGPIQVRIPGSQLNPQSVPGPILEICRGGKWVGRSSLQLAGHSVASIQTDQLENGPLRSTHRITYTFEGGSKYIATVQCEAGIDFVRLHEDMESLSADAQGKFDFVWEGCDFQYRQAPNHPWPENFPRRPLEKHTAYPWEPIAPVTMDTQFGVSPGISSTGKMPFSLALYEPWSDVAAASFANFWSNESNDAAGIFIDHPEQWQDHEFSIWHFSHKMPVDFFYTNRELHFVWNIGRGSRSSCVMLYDHARDVEAMKTLAEMTSHGIDSESGRFRTGLFPTSYALNQQNWHGTLNLDKIKNWTLSYPENGKRPQPLFKVVPWNNAQEFYATLARSEFVSELALSGVRQNHGFGPTSSRALLEAWIPGYQFFRSQLSRKQQCTIETILLVLAYVHAGEDYMPMLPMLGGHPNFLSDVKSTPAGVAFLFPDHPQADVWADKFVAYLRLNTRYHTRPAVKQWNARGGRWTENLGTYVWAFLRPAVRAAFLLKARDGEERLATPQLVSVGDWLVNALSAPFAGENPETMKMISEQTKSRHYWGVVTPANGPRRQHPPIGAHSERRKTPRLMWYLGNALSNYSPLVSEHLMWAARPTDQDMEQRSDDVDPYAVMFSGPDNRGTNPHLRTSKYTGYGITMRAAVDTPQEISIHLLQIDDGPNYRWSNGSEGSCGVVYFYANGKGYSYNGAEDVGDRIDQDTDFSTNFGVWKNGAFRSIGQNVLSSPCYDLKVAQFAQITSRSGSEAYSWPEYLSRSILLAGDDYFVLYDRVYDPQIAHRFSWFVRKGDDFPKIAILSGTQRGETGTFSAIETETTSGRWVDGRGNSLVLITHKDGVRAEPASFGGRVHMNGSDDHLFIAPTTIAYQDEHVAFTGTSGVIRNRAGEYEVALFHGTLISAAGLTLSTNDTDLGISATVGSQGAIRGKYFAPKASAVSLRFNKLAQDSAVYVDGAKLSDVRNQEGLTFSLPAGAHEWELTRSLPCPIAPAVTRTEYAGGGAMVFGEAVPSAAEYTLEISEDNASTWKVYAKETAPRFQLRGLKNGAKYHVRLLANNSEQHSMPGPEYPLYITDQIPSAPIGLHMDLRRGSATLSWGETLGTSEYRLYRKRPGESAFRIAYSGLLRTWTDENPEIQPPAEMPSDRPEKGDGLARVCQYYVTAVNHNGESRPSRISNTDPTSWRNWNPTGDEPFRRTVDRSLSPLPNDGIGRYYPE